MYKSFCVITMKFIVVVIMPHKFNFPLIAVNLLYESKVDLLFSVSCQCRTQYCISTCFEAHFKMYLCCSFINSLCGCSV